jgi:putative membrane protein
VTEWLPYCGGAPLPAEWWLRWNFDPVLLFVLVLAAAIGWRRVRPRSAERKAFAWSLGMFAVLFVSPFCALGSALFAARVVHHILLAVMLAPLLVTAFALHRWRIPNSLPVLTALQTLVFWSWHVPLLYEAALSSDAVFWAMQGTITGSAALWWMVLRRTEPLAAVAALLATMIQMGILGALLTFASRAYYAPHRLTTQPWGLSPLEDQQTAGIIMWAPASAIYLLLALTILYRHLRLEPAR